ncbi:hypothetical protein Tco_1526242 [Tanacetum coccineum]
MIVMMKKTMMMMKALQLDQTRVGQHREEDPNLQLLGQLSLLRKMITKVQRNHESLMHLLPYKIQLLPQLDGRSLTQDMIPHKEDSLVLLYEIPLLCQRRGLLIRPRSSRVFKLLLLLNKRLLTNKFLEWEADVDSEHFDRDDNARDDNEETGAGDDNVDPAEIYK